MSSFARSPLVVGDAAPRISLAASSGREEHVTVLGRATLVYFFRGKWCPFCNTYLEALAGLHGRLLAAGEVRVVAPESLADVTATAASHRLRFPLLADPDLLAIDAFRVRHPAAGPRGRDIPRPALFVSGPDGTITYAQVGKNPLDRPPPDGVAAELEKAAGARSGGYVPRTFDSLKTSSALVLGALARTATHR